MVECRLPQEETSPHEQQDRQGNKFLTGEVNPRSSDILPDRPQVLGGIGHFQAQQDNHPGQINPDHQDRQSRHGSVNSIVTGYADLEI